MNISVICSDTSHPIFPFLEEWKKSLDPQHNVQLVSRKEELTEGDVLFLISCHEIIGRDIRNLFSRTLVIHASDLPYGRGWSPHIWQLIEGKSDIVVTLLEADDSVDTGGIWKKMALHIEKHELSNEINDKLFKLELELMTFAIEHFESIVPQPQSDEPASYYRKRTPADSRINPQEPLASQFNLLRVCDPQRYPAFFDLHGYRYKIKLEKVGPIQNLGKR